MTRKEELKEKIVQEVKAAILKRICRGRPQCHSSIPRKTG